MAAAPIFVGTPKIWHQALSVANTARDGSGTAPTLVSGGSVGSRIDRLRVVASGTVTSGVIRYILNDGTNKRLYRERIVTATTPSTSVAVFEDDVTFTDGLILPNGWSLLVATNNAETFNVFAHGGDL